MSKTKLKLPKPDQYGNYWFAEHRRDLQHAPAIFPSKRRTRDGQVVQVAAKFYASLGLERGWLMDGLTLRTFANPHEALRAIEAAM